MADPALTLPLPPESCPGEPQIRLLPAGRRLFRVHNDEYPATSFNPTPASELGGGRFDCLERASPSFLYAGENVECAVAESLLRYVPDPPAPQIFQRARLKNRVLSEIEVQRDLEVVSLCGPDVRHLGADTWLTKCPASLYPGTRLWGAAVRRWVPDTNGFVWWSRREEDARAYVFYDHSTRSADFKAVTTQPLDRRNVQAVLARYNVTFL